MNTGIVEANLVRLNEDSKLTHVSDLIARKVEGDESGTLNQADVEFHEREFLRLTKELEDAHERSHLPESAQGAIALNDLLVRIRTNGRQRAVSE